MSDSGKKKDSFKVNDIIGFTAPSGDEYKFEVMHVDPNAEEFGDKKYYASSRMVLGNGKLSPTGTIIRLSSLNENDLRDEAISVHEQILKSKQQNMEEIKIMAKEMGVLDVDGEFKMGRHKIFGGRRTRKKRRMKKGGNKNEEIADGKFSVTSEDGKIASNKMNFATKKEYFSWLKERPGIWRTGFHFRYAFNKNKLISNWDSDPEIDDGTKEWYYHLRNNMVQQHRIFLMKEAKGKENYNKMIPIIRYEEKNEDGTFDIFDFRMVPEHFQFDRCSGRFSGTIDSKKVKYINTSLVNKGKLYSGQPCERKMMRSACEQYYSCINKKCEREKPKATYTKSRMSQTNVRKWVNKGDLPFTGADYVGFNLPVNLKSTYIPAPPDTTYGDNNYTPSIIASSSDFNKPNSGGKKKKRRRKSTKKKRKRRRTKKKRRRTKKRRRRR